MSIFSDIMTLLVSIYCDCVLLISPSTMQSLIECRRDGVQLVGETGNPLHTWVNGHRLDTYLWVAKIFHLLGECRTLWGEREQAMHLTSKVLSVLLFLQSGRELYSALAFPRALPFPTCIHLHNNILVPRPSPPLTVVCKTTGGKCLGKRLCRVSNVCQFLWSNILKLCVC